jgi:hypothetical protein
VYQVGGQDVTFTWLESEPDSDCRKAMLDWLAGLALEQISVSAQRMPGVLAPIYVEMV